MVFGEKVFREEKGSRFFEDLSVLGLYTFSLFISILLKRTTFLSLGKGFWVSSAEKDIREGVGSFGVERG